MELTRKRQKDSRQLPLQQNLIRDFRMQGTAKKSDAEQTEEQRHQTVGTVKVWSVVE